MSVLLADQAEVMALALVSTVPASKIAAAFNEPEQFFAHMTLEELGRLQDACARMGAVQVEMGRALAIFADLMRATAAHSQE